LLDFSISALLLLSMLPTRLACAKRKIKKYMQNF